MSNTNVLIPQDAANILKCSLCEKYLSVPPIFTTEGGEEKYLCGRCSYLFETRRPVLREMKVRAKMYENLAQFMLFPCINAKCDEKLLWGTVTVHEKVCRFRTITCPSDDCNRSIEMEQIITHFSVCHSEYKKTDCIEVCDYATTQYLGFSVFCFNQEDSSSTFEVTISFKDNSFTVPDQKIVLFNDIVHCINCVMLVCKLREHKYSTTIRPYSVEEITNEILTTQLDNRTIKHILNSNNVDYIISINDNGEQPPKAKKLKLNTRFSTKVNELREKERENIVKLLKENIECPICNCYMSSPIYLCSTGHSLCEGCLNKLHHCPLCQAKFVKTRNYSLEKFSEIYKLTQPNRPKHPV